MNHQDVQRRAAQIERELRAEGVPAMMIPAILGAAFIGSLTNLPAIARPVVIAAHLTLVRELAGEISGYEQAPDGPMPGL